MKTIYKYPLEINDHHTYELSGIESLLHVGLDPNGIPCFWATVDTQQTQVRKITIWVVGTGNPLPEDEQFKFAIHKGTFVHGPFVWHVFFLFE